ncbi:DUF4129 domain-containing protein [Psychromicrobium lacuslunae]|uniref:Protein-glutamine gamma-glutamyltransferase-like C-terminal domain-containing protein n=1 Tax=Psychromicrobium lacuslunae TaxID=1618207 RepID=A0A0D4BYM6_9MICC|nr:DUF4129 domain-containing protein [Psychromicrobium lacuslunae]AJT41443.1 hypothetical protein UM93_07790 [Psychromicrobium lacuslunae]
MRFFDAPVSPDAEQARKWAIDELAKRQYQDAQPGLAERLMKIVSDFFNSLLNGLSGALHIDNGLAGLLLVLVPLIVIGLIIFLVRPRLLRRQQHEDAEIFEVDSSLSAAEHRQRAAQAATAGDYDSAITELFRAIVRAAEERVVIDPQPGRTAEEVTLKLVAAFPSESQPLWRTARLFNQIRYSERKSAQSMASEADYQELRRLDQSLLDSQPAEGSTAQLEWVGPQ